MLPSPPPSPEPRCTSAYPEARLGQTIGGHFQLIEILGVGAYGVVYKAVDLRTGTPHAVKALRKVGLEPRQRMFQQREISLHHTVSAHPNVVSMIQLIDLPDCMYCVMEFCPEGDLFAKITEEERYVGNDYLIKQVFMQILDAVEYCHSLGIYHRDLKPENILVCNNGQTVKVADFGLATREFYNSDFGCGSTFYMSPECQQTNPDPYSCYSSAANDVWSLGVILVNLASGRNPWKRAHMQDSTFKAYMKDRGFLKSILPISDELDVILRSVFEPNPNFRCTVAQLKYAISSCSSFSKRPECSNHSPATPPYTPVDSSAAWQSWQCRPFTPLDVNTAALANRFSQLTTAADCVREVTPPQTPKKAASQTFKVAASTSSLAPAPCSTQSFVSSAVAPFYNIIPTFTTHITKHGGILPPRVIFA